MTTINCSYTMAIIYSAEQEMMLRIEVVFLADSTLDGLVIILPVDELV